MIIRQTDSLGRIYYITIDRRGLRYRAKKQYWKSYRTRQRKKIPEPKKFVDTIDFKLADIKIPDETRSNDLLIGRYVPKKIQKYIDKRIKIIRDKGKVWGIKISMKTGKRRRVYKTLRFNEKKYEYDIQGYKIILDNVIDRMRNQWLLPSHFKTILKIEEFKALKDRRIK